VKLIEKSWDGYRKMVVPGDASRAQLEGSRMAFFGGATAMFHIIFGGLDRASHDATPRDFAMLDGLKAELEAFAAGIGAQEDRT